VCFFQAKTDGNMVISVNSTLINRLNIFTGLRGIKFICIGIVGRVDNWWSERNNILQ
jgi:hypothetical protein